MSNDVRYKIKKNYEEIKEKLDYINLKIKEETRKGYSRAILWFYLPVIASVSIISYIIYHLLGNKFF